MSQTPVAPAAPAKLVGSELLARVQELKGKPVDVVAYECGYYRTTTNKETGETKVRVDEREFSAAVMGAQGLDFAPSTQKLSRRAARRPTVKLGKTGNIVVGGRHSEAAGFFQPGVESEVWIVAEPGKITITAYVPEEGDEAEATETEQDELDL